MLPLEADFLVFPDFSYEFEKRCKTALFDLIYGLSQLTVRASWVYVFPWTWFFLLLVGGMLV